MKLFLHLAGVLVFFVALLGAPAHLAAASVTSVDAQMMEMADGSPCPPKDCAMMPDCTMALPGGVGVFAVLTPDVSTLPSADPSSDVFGMTDLATHAMVYGDGLRRPPKI